MRVNGLKLKTGRVFGAFVLVLNLCFLGGFVTATWLATKPLPPKQKIARQTVTLVDRSEDEFDRMIDQLRIPEHGLEMKRSSPPPRNPRDDANPMIQSHVGFHRSLSDKIEAAPQDIDSHLARGQFYLEVHLYRRALYDFERAIEIQDDSFLAYLGRGVAHRGLGNYEESESDLTEAIDLNAALAEGYLERARTYIDLENFDAALRDFDIAHRRDQNNETVLLEWARLLERNGQFEEACKTYRKKSEFQNPSIRYQVLMALSRIAEINREGSEKCFIEFGVFVGLDLEAQYEWLTFLSPSQDLVEHSKWTLELLRRELAVQHHFESWRLGPQTQLTRLERTYKATLLFCSLSLLKSAGNEAVARSLVLELQQHFPTSPEAALALGILEKSRESLEAFEQRLQVSPCLSAREYRHARTMSAPYFDQGETSPGLVHKQHMAFSRILFNNPWNYQARFERAKSCRHKEHQLYNCNEDLRQVLEVNARHWPAVLLLTQNVLCNRSELSLKEAKSLLDRLVDGVRRSSQLSRKEKDSLFARAYFLRAQVCKAQGQSESMIFADARGALFHLNGDTPKSLRQMIEIHQWLADEFQSAGNKSQSIAHLALVEECRKLAKARSLSAFEEGMKERERRCYNEAIELFNVALAYDPQRINARTERAVCYFKIGHFIAGIVDMAKAVELDHREHRNFFKKIYYMNYAIDLKRVIDEINKLVEAKPHLAHIHYLKGFFYVAMTDFKEYDANVIRIGKNSFAKALEINPHFVSAHVLRADLLIKEGKMDEAHKDLDKALKLAPDSWDAYYWKAVACGAQRRAGLPAYKVATTVALGKSYLTKAMKNYPGFAERVFKEPSLDGLFTNDKEQRRFIESFGLLDDE